MEKDNKVLSLADAKLIINFTHNKLSEEQKNELDEWLCASDENLMIFEELTQDVNDNVFSADELIIETEAALEL